MKSAILSRKAAWRTVISLAAVVFCFALISCQQDLGKKAQAPFTEQAVSDAIDVYVYGYPLVTMDMTRKVITNFATVQAARGPMGQIIKLRTYPAVNDHAVTAPNADTLYTTAWIDVSKEPWVFSIPDMGDRYYLIPMLDGWTDVFQVPGKRTTVGKAQKYAITGPGWTGKLPDGVTEYKSPTGMVWILGRIYCTGSPDDYAKVHALQDKFSLVPLGSYAKTYTPLPGEVDNTLDMKTDVRDQVDGMGANEYFTYLAKLMKTNPPSAGDAPMLAKMATIGIVPGQDFDASRLSGLDKEAIKAVPKLAQLRILEGFKKTAVPVNGWMCLTKNSGIYGTDYLQRAFVTAIGLGANRPQDAIYPTSEKDANGKEYDGTKKYVMHFDKGQFPPVDGFWSLTMYDKDMFFVPNPLNRNTLSSRNKFLTNTGGSVDLYIQSDSPGKAKEANWLPAPKARFIPTLRLYWPKDTPPSIIDGTWKPPAIKLAE
jgi:hypothetical protein